VARNPLDGLAALPCVPGLAAVVVILIGSTGFDGLTRTQFWQAAVPPDSVLLGTAGLLALVAAVGSLYAAAMRVGARLAGLPAQPAPHAANAPSGRPAYVAAGARPGPARRGTAPPPTRRQKKDKNRLPPPPARAAMAGLFAHSLVPIALGYAVAHYFSFLLFEGQVLLALVSDPFGSGWDLFGTADRSVDYLLIGTNTIAWVQICAIVTGHISGVVAAHDRALSLLQPPGARRSQYPLAAVMIGITLCGVLLLVSS
jgi:hypothetical protein